MEAELARQDEIVAHMRANPQNVRFADLARLCERLFGRPRQSGGSHLVFRMPWPGDPRVNIQEGQNGRAKAYQVRQVLKAVDRLEQDSGNG